MPLKVLIAPDKFKGTLTARAAAQAIVRGWRTARPGDILELLPITDGGDGFGAVMSGLFGAQPIKCKTVDAAHRPCSTNWWWDGITKTAIIESANVIGLAMLPPGKFHPFDLDTFGLGKVLAAAQAKGAKHILIGIGGSATNDGGFGLAGALDWKFLDANGKRIQRWTELERLSEIRPPPLQKFSKVVVAVDVQNKLLGARGATRVYGPQKGLGPQDFDLAERCLRQMAQVTHRQLGRCFEKIPGSGAAGGLGFGLVAFLDAKVESGFALFAKHSKLERHLRTADLAITGEGRIDRSTFMGKGVGQITQRCAGLKIPCIGFAGQLEEVKRSKKLFALTAALTQLATVKDAKADPAHWLSRLAGRTAHQWISQRS